MPTLKKIFIHLRLARASNLPTVWSNVTGAYLLSGSNHYLQLSLSLIGSSFLYASGMYLNDWFDADYDAQNAQHRPLPKGEINKRTVLIYSVLGFFIGTTSIILASPSAAPWACLLVSLIIWYNADHKGTQISPYVMAGCRFTLYPMVSFACTASVSPSVFLAGSALFCYTLGISFTASSSPHSKRTLSLFALAGAIPMLAINLSETLPFIIKILTFIGWFTYILKNILLKSVDIDKTISQLIAAIVFVDLLFILDQENSIVNTSLFLALFATTRVFQKYIPAN